MGTLADVLLVARRNLGFVEGPNNKNPYAPLVGHANHQPWCASFVAAVMKRAGVALTSSSAYTPTMANGFKAAGRWREKGQPGDVVFFEWPGMGRIAHVGIVETVHGDGSYTCIEGNTDVAGGRTGGRVMRQRRRANIAGFGRPVYTAPRAVVAPPAKAPARAAKPVAPKYPGRAFKTGAKGLHVTAIQKRLKITADGDFGPATARAVQAFQKKAGLPADGVVGAATWVRLFG